jgi:hypothetical protein
MHVAGESEFGLAVTYLERGDIARMRGDYAGARLDYQASFDVNKVLEDKFLDFRLPHRLGLVGASQGDPEYGENKIYEALVRTVKRSALSTIPLLFSALGLCAALQNQPERAMRWLGIMDTTLEYFHIVLIGPEAVEYSRTLALTRDQAGVRDLAAWRAEGRQFTPDEILQLAGDGRFVLLDV